MERDQNLVRPRDAHNKFARHIWAKCDEWFAFQCRETAYPMRSQEMARIQSSMAKSQPNQERSIMRPPTTFEYTSDQRFVRKGTEPLNKSEARKWRDTLEQKQKVTIPWEAHNKFPTNVELNLISGMSANARKLIKKLEDIKQRKFRREWPKVNQSWGGP